MRLLPLLLVLVPTLHAAQQTTTSRPAAPPPAAPAPAPKNGLRAEFLVNVDEVAGKLVALAKATPQEKYTWRPAEGVRSISEVYMHVAGGNYFLGTFLGIPAPAGLTRDMEKLTDKQRVIAELERSFDHIRDVANRISDADLDKAIKMFGRQTTGRGVLITMMNHLHEHLGQSIAYARMNGVVPPWSGAD